jgi:D-glycero-alpha-D-manno-heptose-7-phosphate kinase
MRICLGGGGTDIPSYYSIDGGLVISAAINKYIYTTFKPDEFEKKLKLRYSQIEVVNSAKELKNSRARELLDMHGISGCEINTSADIPSNTGMGSSGSFIVGLSHCVRHQLKLNQSPAILAEEACFVEIEILKEPVGKQDQYISAYGGIQIFKISNCGHVQVIPLDIPNPEYLFKNIRLYYLNIKRDASEVLAVQNKMQGNTKFLLDEIKILGTDTVDILQKGDFDEYGLMMDKYWFLKKQLSDKISISEVDLMYDYLKETYGVLGGKIGGGGGGGFFTIYCPKNHSEIDEFMWKHGYSRLNYGIDMEGSKILYADSL